MSVKESIGNFFGSLSPHMIDDQEMKNSVFSPYSIFSVLSMTSGGSNGDTLDQMCRTLSINPESIHNEMKKLHGIFKRGRKQLSVAEGIFTQVEILKDFEDLCKSNYGAMIETTKFPQPGLNQVNGFVKKSTRGMIPKIVDNLGPLTRMVLINAIYFKANWSTKFVKSRTRRNYRFHGLDGKPLKCSMMTRSNSKEMYSKDFINGVNFKSCRLPYIGNTFSMLFIKPIGERKEEIQKLFKNVICSPARTIERVISNQKKLKLKRLYVPKFSIESEFRLGPVLQRMGMTDAFDEEKADFSKMTTEEKLLIDEVIHKAKIIVDETGTEAAAATAVVMRTLSMAPKNVDVDEFVLDRPFFCFIVHEPTKIPVFCTLVVSPKFVEKKKKKVVRKKKK